MEDEVKYNHRLFYIASGLLIILLSISCVLNMGVVSRGIAFPFFYLFGFGAYFLYAFFIVQGFSLMIRCKGYMPKSFFFNLGLGLSIVGGLFIYSVASYYNGEPLQAINTYNDRFFTYDPNYFEYRPFVNVFQGQLAGGFFGFLYVFVFYNWLGSALSLTIAIIIASVGVILLLAKPTIKLIQYIRVKVRNMPPREKREKKIRKKPDTIDEFDSYVGSNIYTQAKIVGRDEINVNNSVSEIKPVSFDNRDTNKTPPIEFTQNIRETGVIIRPEFSLGGENKEQKREYQPEPKVEIVEEAIAPLPQVSQPVPEVTKPVIQEEHHEQMNLDFDAPRELNQELLFKQPEMAPLKEITTPAQPTPTPMAAPIQPQVRQEEAPVFNEPAKRKPIVWIPPSTELLSTYQSQEAEATNIAVAEERKELINQVFNDFNIAATCSGYTIGPSITRFHIHYSSNGLVKNVQNLVQDISRRLSGVPVRFEATVSGYDYSGLEVPNGMVTTVSFKEVFESLEDVKKHPFNIAFGKDISGKVVVGDFDKFPHLLVSGTTGSGKSVFVNSIITTLIMRMSPDELRVALIDPKRVEMNKYKDIPHLLCPVVNEPQEAYVLMKRLVEEMEDRYRRFEIADCSTNVKEYNEYAEEHGIEKMYYILAILDEYADLNDNCKELAGPVQSLCQKARAAGIHLMIATQRPTVNVITGTIKANLSTRVALSAASAQDSMVVLDQGGAEDLMGNGDMLVKYPLLSRSGPMRLQGCYIQGKEIMHVVSYLKEHYQVCYEPKFLNLDEKMNEGANELLGSEKFTSDAANSDEEKYQSIKEWVMTLDYVSMSKIQRECGVGFNRAGRIFKRLQEEGVVASTAEAAARGNKVLVNDKFYSGSDVASSEQEK
ncbi:MAG: hypothetical protein E7178_00295 [Erysipelotrichaceae bacterium]|nr:hypothetical protein [Erysipelotrichaceae bacterium]